MSNTKPTPEEALGNLHSAAERLQCDGAVRDVLRISTQVIADLIADSKKRGPGRPPKTEGAFGKPEKPAAVPAKG